MEPERGITVFLGENEWGEYQIDKRGATQGVVSAGAPLQPDPTVNSRARLTPLIPPQSESSMLLQFCIRESLAEVWEMEEMGTARGGV